VPRSSITINGESFENSPLDLPGNTDYYIQFEIVDDIED